MLKEGLEVRRGSPELSQKREVLFKGILVNKLFDTIKNSMEEADVSPEAITGFLNAVKKLPEEDALSVLAIPHELQNKMFSRFNEQLTKKKTTPEAFLALLHKNAKEKGYRLGFHISTKDIEPTDLPQDEEDEIQKWEISGTEQDHRDNDLLRAYYSLDYQNLYRKKGGDHLYLVRAETGPSTSHRQDNDGSWGRASTLSIITRLNLPEVDRQIDMLLDKKNSEEIKKAA